MTKERRNAAEFSRTNAPYIALETIQPLTRGHTMSKEESLVEILEAALPLPPKVVLGYKNLEPVFTSGDLARVCDISRSSAKFYVNKMVELRLVAKVPHKRMYQKYPNATTFSAWLRDLMKLAIEPLESGQLPLPEEKEEED